MYWNMFFVFIWFVNFIFYIRALAGFAYFCHNIRNVSLYMYNVFFIQYIFLYNLYDAQVFENIILWINAYLRSSSVRDWSFIMREEGAIFMTYPNCVLFCDLHPRGGCGNWKCMSIRGRCVIISSSHP